MAQPVSFVVGERVEAQYNKNPTKHFYPAKITKITQGPMPGSGMHPNSEGNIFFYVFCCCFLCRPVPRFYDLEYDDGRVEKRVDVQYIRRLPPAPQLSPVTVGRPGDRSAAPGGVVGPKVPKSEMIPKQLQEDEGDLECDSEGGRAEREL
uniref:Uncharacterized protein n=1 Tax=Chromera velia CCMP2878 TaxID=1169474 RepID=A0A0G4I433_9ALVE|mmetsp:Transcript_1705/g.3521  ORF Transcript_1705/g.3521 Transcript_1705/m.3521 type:complete len:150 (-) Transcript_1705:151-600(-)|eukprot:Cvel_10753.t1-p1 / transcript=Cvel_10753.t1 / gene=Cvel_10753 / organism=Chromera_velia_CCMP2878 / gene_product=hypothetical protein / transcript_product=hypothetical protein / location=Cvel_scaffold656:29471-29917(+) / protein_length=149 / sequence_SO=supercontig / SO=protein_coding / is_pseudo=false